MCSFLSAKAQYRENPQTRKTSRLELTIKPRGDAGPRVAGRLERAIVLDNEKVLEAIERVTIGAEKIEIQLSDAVATNGQDRTLTLPWLPPSPYPRREPIQGEGEPRAPIRTMRVRARAVFAESLRNAHRWLDELIRDPDQTIEVIAAREHKSERSIRMTCRWPFSPRPSSPQP